jgi:hypothetical protein
MMNKKIERIAYLDSEWWQNNFCNSTLDGVEPYLFKSILPAGFLTPEEIAKAFRLMQKEPDKARVRVYIGEERRDDLAAKALKSHFLLDESLLDFMARVAGEERFSLILNRLQDWSKSLTASIGEFLQSMFAVRGIPLGGSEMVVFAGNYAGTAFGVHRGFENAFLIHLGPGIKEFYCWSEKLYKELTGSLEPTFGDYDYLLSRADKFVLEPGDIFYLPSLVFHVGKQENFSVSVACPLYTYPTKRLLKEVVSNLAEQIPFDETGSSPHQSFIFNANPLQELVSNVAKEIFDDWIHRQIPMVLNDYWFRLISNGGFDLSENHVDEARQEIDLVSQMTIANTKIRLKKPYRICWSRHNCDAEDVQVFLRGHSTTVSYSEEIIALFRHLNDGSDVYLDAFRSAIKDLCKISKTNGFEILET